MAIISWKYPITGNWTVAADWSTGSVPGAGDDVTLGLASGYTIFITSPISVESISLDDIDATLSVNEPGEVASISGNLVAGGDVVVDGGTRQGGTTLSIGGALTSTRQLDIGNTSLSAPTIVTANALFDTGGITVSGSASNLATLNIAAPAGFGTAGLLSGGLNMTGNSLVEFASGQITTVAGTLNLNGPQAFVAEAGSTTSNSALTGLSEVAGNLNLDNGASIAVAGNLGNTGSLSVDGPGNASGSSLTVGGTLTNMGGFNVGDTLLTTPDTVTLGGLVNADLISISGNAGAGNRGTLDVTAAAGTGAPGVLTGSIGLSGDALLEFASGQITTIAGTLNLNGPQAFVADAGSTTSNSALTGLSEVAGNLNLDNGASIAVAGKLGNTGSLSVDGPGNASGSSLTVGGTLTNMGGFNVGDTLLTTPDTVTLGGLVNADLISISGNAGAGNRGTLDVTAAAGTGAPGVLTGSIGLSGDALLEFASGQITTVAGTLNLNGPQAFVADAGSTTSNRALTGLSEIAGNLNLDNGASIAVAGSLGNTGSVSVDGPGNASGSSLTVAGTLTNVGGFNVGDGALTTPDTVTLGGLVNAGSIGISGNASAGNLATLTVSGAAKNAGNVSVGMGSNLDLTGADAYTQAAGTTTVTGTLVAQTVDVTAGTLDGTGSVSGNIDQSGGIVFGGSPNVPGNLTVDGNYTEGANGVFASVITGTASNQVGTLAVNGGATLDGGVLDLQLTNFTPTLGQSFTVMTFTPGSLTGAFGAVEDDGALGDGTGVDIGGGLRLAVTYDNADGKITANVVSVASGDAWSGASANWSTAADWSTGVPGSSDTAILGSLAGYTVTISAPITPVASLDISDPSATLNVTTTTTLSNGDLNNVGSLAIDTSNAGGNTVTIGGVLRNGRIVAIGNSGITSSVTLTASGLENSANNHNNGGTINLAGSTASGTTAQAELNVLTSAPAELTGQFNLSGKSLLQFASGGITAIGANSGLTLSGSGAQVAISGNSANNNALDMLSANAGALDLIGGASIATGSNFDNTGTISLDTFIQPGGSSLTIGGVLTNSGNIQLGASGLERFDDDGIIEPDTLTATGLNNTGSIAILGSTAAVNPAQAAVIIAGAAPATLSGTYSLLGNALLQFGSGAITAIGSNSGLTLNGSAPQVAISGRSGNNAALDTLSANAGTLDLIGGASVATSSNFDNTGTVDLDSFFQPGGSSLTIGGVLTNSGDVVIGNSAITVADTVTAAGLDSLTAQNAEISLNGGSAQAELNILSAAPTTLTGQFNLAGNALLEFASGGITAIGSNSGLTLNGSAPQVAISGKSGNNSALDTLSANAGTLDLIAGASIATSTDFDNTGTVELDSFFQPGGSALNIGGVLTNSGDVFIGNSAITAADTVTAAGLGNLPAQNAEVSLNGGQAQASLKILSAAPTTLTGSFNLSGNSLLQFASGGITAIAGNSSLSLNGSAAQVGINGNAANNAALETLAENLGSLTLSNGAAVATNTGVDFTNTGNLNVDGGGAGGGDLAIGGKLTNDGNAQIGNDGTSTATTLSAASLDNAGTLNLANGDASLAGALTNLGALNIGDPGISLPTSMTAASLDNTGSGTITLTGSAGGANGSLIIQGLATNASTLALQPSGFAEVGGLDNTGSVVLSGSAGTPSNLGVIGSVSNFGSVTVGAFSEMGVTGNFDDAGTLALAGNLDVTGGLTIDPNASLTMQGGTLIESGTSAVTIDAGGTATGNGNINDAIANDGNVTATGGLLTVGGAVTGTGQLNIGTVGAELEIGGVTAETMSFGGNVGTFKLDAPASVTGAFTGLVKGDIIDLAGIQATSAVVNGSTLTVTAGSQTLNYQVSGAGLSGNLFAVENDQHGGTDLVLGPPGPVIDGPTTQTVFTLNPAVLGPLSIQDPNPGAGILTAVVTAQTGFFAAAQAGAGTVMGNFTNSATLTGTLADLNAEMASLAYLGVNVGSDEVTVSVTDANNLTTIQKIAINVDAVPDTTPVLNSPDTITLIDGVPTAIGNLSVNDPFSNAVGSRDGIEVSSDPPSIFTANGVGGVVTNQNTNSVAVTGTTSQINGYFSDDLLGFTSSLGSVGAKLSSFGDLFKGAAVILNLLKAAKAAGGSPNFFDGVDAFNSLLKEVKPLNIQGIISPPSEFFQVGVSSVSFVLGALNALAATGKLPTAAQWAQFQIDLEKILAGKLSFLIDGKGANLVTAGGTTYSFDAAGEFILTKSTQPGNSFQVQVRLQPVATSQSSSAVTQIAAAVGGDRVTFGVGRQNTLSIDGATHASVPGQTISLSGGRVQQVSPNVYQVVWNTGEVLTVTNHGDYLGLSVGYAASDAANTVAGLMGTNNGSSGDFTLPDGTALQQPLTTSELYGVFANAWRVTQSNSLFDYEAGQNTATFSDAAFPAAPIALSDLPTSVVTQAAAAVAAAGITDANLAAAAELDYIASGGDSAVLAADASAFQGLSTSAVPVTPSGSAPPVLGVIGIRPDITVGGTGATAVSFEVYLTAPLTTDTTVDYSVIATQAGDLDATAFGGTLPSGTITIAAGQTTGQITIDVPQGALGSLAEENLALDVSSPTGIPVFAGTARVGIDQPLAGPPAQPELTYLSNIGTFTRNGNNYTLDLGAVQLGELLPQLKFSISNAASAPADQLTGTFTWPAVAGFTINVGTAAASGAGLPSPIGAGQSFQGLIATVDEDKFGANSETVTFNPVDTNASGFTAPLTPISLTITDSLELPGMIYSQAFGDVHILTYNGLNYDFQATGDYVLANSRIPGDNFQIQLELAPWHTGASVTTIHQVAIALGSDRVTFDWTRPDTVLVDGVAPTTLSVGSKIALAGGTITEVSPSMFKVDWATGETMTVSQVSTFNGSFINVLDGVPGNIGPGAYAGLQGEDEGAQNDFQLADGTVLRQPLTSAELYGIYAGSWQVAPAASLFDGPTPPAAPPTDPVTLADLPTTLVTQAARMVAAAGITDPGIAADTELDYIATGDPSVIAAAADVQQQVIATTPSDVATSPSIPAIGVATDATKVVEQASGPTAVTFTAYLTSVETTDTTVDYTVSSPGAGFLGAPAFGGALPSGSVTIAAGHTSTQFTLEVPQGALGSDPADNLEVTVSNAAGMPIFAPTAQTEIVKNQPEPGNLAAPELAKISGNGTLTFNAATNTYTLDLGGLTAGSALQAVQLAVINAAMSPADSLGGTFTPPTGSGFTITGDNVPSPLGAGQSYQGLYVSVNNFTTGANTMTLTFDPTDVNDSGYSAALAPITLKITDTVTPPAVPQVNTPATIIFPNVHVGGTDSQHVSVTNTAAAGAGNLDVTLTASGSATATGAISGLAPGATDATDLSVGIDTSAAGARSGGVTENFTSDAGGGNTSPIAEQDPYIDAFGSVYRLAQASLLPTNLTVHVGDPGTQEITLTNIDPNDSYSENLIATVVGTTGALTASGTTGDIAPQADGTIAVKFSTATAGSIGTVTLDLKSDGTGIDGLGVTDLGDVTIPVTVTSGNVAAAAQFEELSGGGTFTHAGSAYSLDLGTISTPVTVNLGVLNSAAASADALAGSFTIMGDSAFANAGFTAFSGIASGQADSAPTVTLGTSTPGTFSETITLQPLDASSSGNLPLGEETLTITGTVAPPQLAGAIAPIAATEGVALPATTAVATFTDTNLTDAAGTFSATIDWGDGTPTTSGTVTGSNGSFTVEGGHVYTDEGSFPVSVAITDTADQARLPLSSTVVVAEGDVLTPQGVAFSANPGQAFTGAVATFTDTNTSNVASDFTATVNWGDGTTTTGVITDNAGAITVSGTHAYSAIGQDVISVTLTEDLPGTAAATALSTAQVTAGVKLAGAVSLATATEGAVLPVSTTIATFTDTNANDASGDFTASINWGDGTTTSGTVVGANGSFAVEGGHAYADEGQDNVVVTITHTADSVQISPSGTITVSDAALAATGTNLTGTEGAALNGVTVATFTDANTSAPASDFTATITWGDGQQTTGTVVANGNGSFSVDGTHTYAEEGSDTIGVAIRDVGGSSASAQSTATIGDAAVAATGTSLTGTEGAALNGVTVATFTDANTGAAASDFSATITWGDGQQTTGTVIANGNGSFSVDGTHAYTDEGSETIGVAIKDVGGSTANATSTATIGDAALAATGASLTGTEGAALNGVTVATFTDANTGAAASDFTATIAWGDGQQTTGTVVANGNGSFAVDGTHAYADEGSYAVGIAIADKGGSTASAQGTATIGDAALAATGASLTGTEGAALNGVTVATFTDANTGAAASDFTATIAWGDGQQTTGTVVANGNGSFAVDGTHAYADEGSYAVGIAIADKGGSTASAQGTATIGDAALAATGASLTGTEGAALNGVTVATFTDANTGAAASDFTATIAWGDGQQTSGTVVADVNGSFSVDGSHTYADEGSYAVGVAIRDDGGSTANATSAATVAEADVLTGQGTSLAANANQALTNVTVATFADSYTGNLASDFAATVNWGDGTTTSGTVSDGNGTFTVTGTHTYAAAGQDNITVTLSEDAPGTATATANSTVNVRSAAPVRMVISEGVTDIDITSFLGSGAITSIGPINYPANLPQKGYTLALVGGKVFLSIANNLPSGGGLSAPDVSFQYTASGRVETAIIKAVNVTPGNNGNTLDLTNSKVGAYDFSYLAGQPHGQNIVLAAGADTDVLAFTDVSDSTPAKFDTVANFDPRSDVLDFSEIPGLTSAHALGTVSTIPGGSIVAPNSVDWLVDRTTNQTIVYANTTSVAENAATASMEIVLDGQLQLSSSNFLLSEPPLTLSRGSSSLDLPAGGSVALPVSVSGIDYGDVVSVTISGLTSYESLTDKLDHTTFSAGKSGTVTLTAAEVDSGLMLNSSYSGAGKPVNTLSLTATNATPGEASETTAAQTITVTDPPPTGPTLFGGGTDLVWSDMESGLQAGVFSTPNAGNAGLANVPARCIGAIPLLYQGATVMAWGAGPMANLGTDLTSNQILAIPRG
jgi:hypothetical protein